MMQAKQVLAAALLLAAGWTTQAGAGEDCPGQPWLDYRGDAPGGACVHMGLNTRKGVCRPGDVYETLCDDRNGQYKICQGTMRCGGSGGGGGCQPAPGYSAYNWDFDLCRPCPPGTSNTDGRNGCGSSGGGGICQPAPGYSAHDWDFERCAPCGQDERNNDSAGPCEREEHRREERRRECQPERGYSAYEWDFERCAPCGRDEHNYDGRGRCEREERRGECQPERGYSAYEWDFKRCRPCGQDEHNYDGRGPCEREQGREQPESSGSMWLRDLLTPQP